MTCKDCMLRPMCFAVRDIGEKDIYAEACKHFKNKADFVEVVRCRDCKYLYCFSAIDRLFYCKHSPKGLQGINIVEENPFCSYGESK